MRLPIGTPGYRDVAHLFRERCSTRGVTETNAVFLWRG